MIITAHSGCDNTCPNSEEFLVHAFASNADAVEVDVRESRGELVLSHDEAMPNAVHLAAAFEMLKKHSNKMMNCDLKHSGLEAKVYKLAEEIGVENQLIYTGEVDKVLFEDKNAFPGVLWYANMGNIISGAEDKLKNLPEAEKKDFLLYVLHETAKSNAAGINWHYKDAEIIWEDAKKSQIGISVWTVDDIALLKEYISRDPDNITTNIISKINL